MSRFFNNKSLNLIIISSILFFLVVITSCYFYLHLNELISISNYAFNELFINYQAGLVRRGLLGEIFWQLNYLFSINPVNFFTYLLMIMYILQIYLFYTLFESFKKVYFIFILIFLSPTLILFTVYDPNLYYLKDIFIKLTILYHAVLVLNYSSKITNNSDYNTKLKFVIIPLLSVVILIHEYQVLFLSIHFLLSLSFVTKKNNFFKILKIYSILIIPILLTLFYIGDQSQFNYLNLILEKFEVSIHPQLGGGLYKAVGGFYKWHFFYFSYEDFVNLISSIFLGILIFYLIFHYLINKKVLKVHSTYQIKYFYFFIPTLACFILALDHGRNISLIATHLVAFYAALLLDKRKFEKLKNEFNKNFIMIFFLLIFLFFYVFMWRLDQMAGFNLNNQENTIFKSSLFAEFIKFVKFSYNYIDINIINLPEIRL